MFLSKSYYYGIESEQKRLSKSWMNTKKVKVIGAKKNIVELTCRLIWIAVFRNGCSRCSEWSSSSSRWWRPTAQTAWTTTSSGSCGDDLLNLMLSFLLPISKKIRDHSNNMYDTFLALFLGFLGQIESFRGSHLGCMLCMPAWMNEKLTLFNNRPYIPYWPFYRPV